MHSQKQAALNVVSGEAKKFHSFSFVVCFPPRATRACDYFHNAPSAQTYTAEGAFGATKPGARHPLFSSSGPPFMRVIISSILGIAADDATRHV
jgi:hypothetical protein